MAIYNLYRKKPQVKPDVQRQLAGQVVRRQPTPTTLDPNIKPIGFDTNRAPDVGTQSGITDVRDRVLRNPSEFTPSVTAGTPVTGVTVPPGYLDAAKGSAIGDGSGATGSNPSRPKTNQELIDEAIRKLLEGVPNADAERKAFEDQNRVNEARAIQSVRARTGVAGMGLTGAAGALESQTRAETGRAQTAAMADFDRKIRQEAAERALAGIGADRGEKVFQAEVELYEGESDLDINKDGFIAGKPVGGNVGDGNPTNNATGTAESTGTATQRGTSKETAIDVTTQPPNTVQVGPATTGGYVYYQDQATQIWYRRRAAAPGV
jgi:hypothetical protein